MLFVLTHFFLGALHNICKNVHTDWEGTADALLLLMCHIFKRLPLHSAIKPASPSLVVLPDLPAEQARVMNEHNRKTLVIFTKYMRNFCGRYRERYGKGNDGSISLHASAMCYIH